MRGAGYMEAVQRSYLVVRGGPKVLEYCGDHEVLDMEDKKVPARKIQGNHLLSPRILG